MVRLADIDAHEQPPEELRANWKAFSRTDHSHMRCHPRIDELMLSTEESEFEVSGKMPRAQVEAAFSRLGDAYVQHAQADVPILHHPLLPGPSELSCLFFSQNRPPHPAAQSCFLFPGH